MYRYYLLSSLFNHLSNLLGTFSLVPPVIHRSVSTDLALPPGPCRCRGFNIFHLISVFFPSLPTVGIHQYGLFLCFYRFSGKIHPGAHRGFSFLQITITFAFPSTVIQSSSFAPDCSFLLPTFWRSCTVSRAIYAPKRRVKIMNSWTPYPRDVQQRKFWNSLLITRSRIDGWCRDLNLMPTLASWGRALFTGHHIITSPLQFVSCFPRPNSSFDDEGPQLNVANLLPQIATPVQMSAPRPSLLWRSDLCRLEQRIFAWSAF